MCVCFRAVYLCRVAKSTSLQPIQTNQGDTCLRSYQVRSSPAPTPLSLFIPKLLHHFSTKKKPWKWHESYIWSLSRSFIFAAHWTTEHISFYGFCVHVCIIKPLQLLQNALFFNTTSTAPLCLLTLEIVQYYLGAYLEAVLCLVQEDYWSFVQVLRLGFSCSTAHLASL